MKKDHLKKSYKLFWAWTALFCIGLTVLSLQEPQPSYFGQMKTIGLVICLLLDLLFVLIYVTESVYWINGVTYEQAVQAGSQARRRYALRHLLCFLGATAVYILYCFLDKYYLHWGNDIRNALVAGGAVCIAALLTIPVKLDLPQ